MRILLSAVLLSLIVACTDEAPDAPATQPEATTAPPVVSPSGGNPSAAAASKAVSPDYGQTYWVAYLAVAEQPDAPELREAEAALLALGLELGTQINSGQLACSPGAPEGLGRSPDAMGVGVWFATEADARAFAATQPRSVGVTQANLGCAD